jgi:hypothetical protein
MTKDEALKMAVEQLWSCSMLMNLDHSDYLYEDVIKAHDACKEALEQPSWQGLSNDMVRAIGEKCEEKNRGILNWIDFYNGIENMLKDKNS